MIKLQRESSVDQVAELLRRAILRGELAPGTALRQEELAAKIGVSRVPLREAFRQLEGEGFLRSDSYKGSYVATVSAAEALDIFELRVLLELHALTLSINRHTPASIAACQKVIDKALADPKIEDNWFEHNWAFHSHLYLPSERPYLLATIKNCIRKNQLYIWVRRVWSSRIDSCKEHQRILNIVAKHQLRQAKELLRHHLSGDLETLRAELKRRLQREDA